MTHPSNNYLINLYKIAYNNLVELRKLFSFALRLEYVCNIPSAGLIEKAVPLSPKIGVQVNSAA